MKSPVVFDIDGVLADFYKGYWRVCRELGKPEPRVGNWNDFWDDDVWKVIRASQDFWQMLVPRVSRDVFKRIRALRDEREVYFATSRPGQHAHWQTVDWLTANMIPHPAVIVTPKKGRFCDVVSAGFMIDDKAGNCVYTSYESPRTAAFLLDAPYNQFDRDVIGSKVRRVDSVEEFLDIIEAS
jgi:phosphoglycolate phosphatase-like HAD superfamily hydrolase